MQSTTKGPPRNVLGRGLGALLEDSITQTIAASTENLFRIIKIAAITVNPCQPRKDFNERLLQELAASIQLHGIIQPLTVRKEHADTYQLIAGERRLRAAQLAGLTEVPAYIRTTDDQHMLELALIENIQRASLNAIEIALSYQRLLAECKLTQDALAERVGKDRTTVNNYLRLLKLPPAIQAALRDQKIAMGHARALINLPNEAAQVSLLKRIVEAVLSVREVEKIVQNAAVDKQLKNLMPKVEFNPDFKSKILITTQQLTHRLHTKVKIKAGAQSWGEIKIVFNSEAELDRIIAAIAPTM
ncbi:ParB/RepB/Spo0J family partition protein [Candidatus Cardinium hertigii]|uniref:Putative chromosome-partitioning protein ParB n=1 Tax=Candidatus Cardinium hertigii TaxID=247481 RepID=A0A2Z3L8I8_9BACT|nr:ParB/RepB/Spo0J family partition protein [Candidatus Cardinium hertigii]AWN81918.1 putative chromosome-partitioning protein ParB [Candidatus Cardinium hertigii]